MLLKSYSFVCFEGENENDNDNNNNDNDNDSNNDRGEKTFTQEEVNTFLAKEKRKTQDAQKKLASQLQEVKKTAELTSEEKIELEKQIEDLQKQYMTVEERARQASDKATKAHEKVVTDLTTERDSWKNRYTQSTITSSIAQAAVVNKAIDVDQIAAMLRPAAKLSEKLDEAGKPTGIFEPRVDFQDIDKDEKPITLDLSISEAVKRMTELPRYGNLFEGGKTGGLGANGGDNSRSGKIDLVKIAREEPARYRELRKKKPELFDGL